MTTAAPTISELAALALEKKARLIAGFISLSIITIIFLALWWFTILVPNPPFPPPDPMKEEELVFDVAVTGGGYEIPGGGSSPSVGPGMAGPAMENPSASSNGQDADVTSPDGVDLGPQGSPTGKDPNAQAVPPPSDALQALLNASHGDNSSSEVNPLGGGSNDPYGGGGKQGDGPTGGGPKGIGDLPGTGGRGVTNRPPLSNPTQTEGIIVVEVRVNKEGRVTEVNILDLLSTTRDAELRRIAVSDAKLYRFEPNPRGNGDERAVIKFDFKLR